MRQLKISKSITNRESPSLEKYLQEIGKVSMITAEEEVQLAIKIKAGDMSALNKLTKANLRFVVSVAKQYQNQGMTLNDLINEGNVGLIKAAQKFDETRGFKFISYAVWWIRQSILQALAEQSRMVRLPLNKVGLSSKINKAVSLLEQEFEREPSTQELSELLNLTAYEIENTLHRNSRHLSLDAPIGGEGSDEVYLLDVMFNPNDTSSDVEMDHNQSLKTEIERTLKHLTAKQADVIKLYFGLGSDAMSLEDIAERYDLTRERVRQIKDKALIKLRTTSKSKSLRDFMGN
jgi:RNA polymerase primary sigma factor